MLLHRLESDDHDVTPHIAQLWAKADRPGVRAFFIAIAALSIALLLALYSGAAGELGHFGLSVASALVALVVAAWVGVTLVPVLAKRTPLRWIGYKMEYKVTREGWIYIGGIIVVALAALNTGNNLLFLILASLIAIILMSGILSSITLSGVEMRLELPEHIFAGQPVRAQVELENEKLTLPSFSLRVEAVKAKECAGRSHAGDSGLFSVSAEEGSRAPERADHVREARCVSAGCVSHRDAIPVWLFAEVTPAGIEDRSARLSVG